MACSSLIMCGGVRAHPISWPSEGFMGRLRWPSRRSTGHGVLARATYHTPSSSAAVALQRLGLRQGASEQDIKKAYRRLALQFHPDVCKGDACTTNFMQINNAYEVVLNCLQGNAKAIAVDPFVGEPMMGVYDEDWEDWEEWMGWEGAGTMDYSNHINHGL